MLQKGEYKANPTIFLNYQSGCRMDILTAGPRRSRRPFGLREPGHLNTKEVEFPLIILLYYQSGCQEDILTAGPRRSLWSLRDPGAWASSYNRRSNSFS